MNPYADLVEKNPYSDLVAKPSLTEELTRGVMTGLRYGGPMGAMIGAVPAASKALDQAAYETGGKVTDIASSAGLPPSAAAGFGFAANVGMQAIPALVGGGGAGKVAAPALESGATHLMQSALKPTLKTLKSGQAATAIQTMLDEGANATMGGVAKLRQKIYELNKEVSNKIMTSTEVVDKKAVYGPLKETLDKFTKQVNPNADVVKIKGAWDEFINHPLIAGDTMPVQLAQELKQGTYKVLSKKYGQVGAAEDEAQKAIARGLKDEIAKAVPEISQLNAQESKIITALLVAERRAQMAGNKNPIGLASLAHSPVGWAAFMADRSDAFKSIIARMLHSGSETIPGAVVGSGIAAGQGLKRQD